MTSESKSRLSAQVLAAIGTMVAVTSPAQAFDTANWQWDLTLTTDINVTGTIDIGSLGGSVIEQEQVQLGSASAVAVAAGATIALPLVSAGVTLPLVTANATAVGNNIGVTSDTAVLLDATQTTMGTLGISATLGLLDLLTLQAGLALPATITADSLASGFDVYVDSSATAVANNMNLASNSSVLSNGTQVSVANLLATATATSAGLSVLPSTSTPIASATATAVGNNLSITVPVPTP